MSPAVLAIETSGRWCSAAVLREDRLESLRAEVGNAHSDHLLAMVDSVLDAAALRLVDCSAVAFGAGPGSFTGLRIACAVAQGLAFGAALPVAAIGTLDALAASARAEIGPGGDAILVAQDARMGELYWALFDASGTCVAGPGLATPEALRERLANEAPIAVGCGNGWSVGPAESRDALRGLVGRVVQRDAPDAVDVARLGRDALRAGRVVEARDARPIYVRDDVARTSAQRAARREGAAVP